MIHYEGSEYLPRLEFDEETGLLKLSGKSVCVDCFDFYSPLQNKLKEYIQSPTNTHIIIDLEYFNTISSVALLDIFRTMSEVTKHGKECKVDWYYEEDDLDLKEAGEDYQELVKRFDVKFNLIQK